MIRLKSKNVNIKELKTQLKCKIFDIALTIRKIEGEDYTVVITSGNDGKHMKNSKHYSNEAIDIRTNNMIDPDTVALRIKGLLGKDFDVVLEQTHIHIEYDPKGYKRIMDYLNNKK